MHECYHGILAAFGFETSIAVISSQSAQALYFVTVHFLNIKLQPNVISFYENQWFLLDLLGVDLLRSIYV